MERTAIIRPSPLFFRCGAAAAAGAVLGIVIAQIVLRPAAPEPGIEGLIRAYADPVLQAQSLTILVQVVAMFVALVTLGVKVLPAAPGLAVLSAAFLVLWQVLELVPRSVDYFVLSLNYAREYVAGLGDAAFIEGEFRRFAAWERGWRSMRQIVWSAGLLLAGLAAWRAPGIGRVVGAVLVLNGLRVAVLFAASMAGIGIPFGRWLFIAVNVAGFGLLAVWLWTSPVPERSGWQRAGGS